MSGGFGTTVRAAAARMPARSPNSVISAAAVEDDVAAQFEEIEGVAIELTCDDEMQVEQGAEYECTGTTADGEEVTLRILNTDETTAAYTWDEV